MQALRGWMALTVAAVVIVAAPPAWAESTSDGAAVSCTTVTETDLNGWIEQANAGAVVTKQVVASPAGCVVPIGPAGLEPLTGKFSLAAAGVVLSGGDSIFDVRYRGTLTLSGVTLTGSTKSAILNAWGGSVDVTDSRIIGNSSRFGGGVDNSGGAMRLVRTELAGNTSTGNGGGISSSGVDATLTLIDCVVRDNTSLYGGGIGSSNGTVLLKNTKLTGNHADGGSAVVNSAGEMTFDGSEVSGNVSPLSAGAITNTGTVHIIGSTVADNEGGAVVVVAGGPVTVSDSRISGNTSGGSGAAVLNGSGATVIVERTEVTGNKAGGPGGGLANGAGGLFRVVDSTVRGNTAGAPGGGSSTCPVEP